MKKKQTTYPENPKPAELKDALAAYPIVDTAPMVRTQIYLSRREHEFVQSESARRGAPMAAVIRKFIDEKMELPADAWSDNPMLRPPVEDPAFQGREDGAINHDHYVYGTPKKWMKRDGKWVETPPVPEDYYKNPECRRKYDEEIDQCT